MTIIIFLFEIAIIAILIFGKGYFSKKGENAAIVEDSRNIGYESKKGENLATKEDIEELTRKIEIVKNEISFENQRKHEFINQRTKRLLNILHHTEKLNEYQAILLYALYDKNSSERLIRLIEQINETLLDFLHECRIVYITIEDKKLTDIISKLIKESQQYAGYMCYIASNANSHMKNWEESLELATQNNNSQQLLDLAIKSQNGVAAIRKEFETSIDEKREALYDFQIKYLAKLNTLFGSDFHIKS